MRVVLAMFCLISPVSEVNVELTVQSYTNVQAYALPLVTLSVRMPPECGALMRV